MIAVVLHFLEEDIIFVSKIFYLLAHHFPLCSGVLLLGILALRQAFLKETDVFRGYGKTV